MRLTDSHTHIDGKEFDVDRAEVLARARAAGVTRMVVVGTGASLETIRRAPALAAAEPDVWAAVGVHPHDAARFPDAEWDELEALAAAPRVVAVGEAGLDFHYDFSPREAQPPVFRRQIRLARRLGKPIVCHVREAHDEALAILREERAADHGVVIHCFTGTPDEARAHAAAGFHVSFSGIVTFKTAEGIRAAVREVPRERLLIETDAPYLAPVPMRGKRCEPAFVAHTAAVVAREAGLEPEALAERTAANLDLLFPPGP